MNDEPGDLIDAAIDRVAARLVDHAPPERMYAAVTLAVTAPGRRRPARRLLWSLTAASAAALLIVAVLLRSQPARPEVAPDTGPVASVAKGPAAPEPKSLPNRASLPVQRPRPRRLLPAMSPEPAVSELAAAIANIEVAEIPVRAVSVTTIAVEPIGIEPIHVSDIEPDR